MVLCPLRPYRISENRLDALQYPPRRFKRSPCCHRFNHFFYLTDFDFTDGQTVQRRETSFSKLSHTRAA